MEPVLDTVNKVKNMILERQVTIILLDDVAIKQLIMTFALSQIWHCQ